MYAFRRFTTLVFTCLALGIAHADETPLPVACSATCVTPYGENLGQSPAGVIAYSNCSANCVSRDASLVDEVYMGMEWQCVEFARRWLYRTQGLVFESVDYAYNIWDDISYLVDARNDEKHLLVDFPNGSSALPQRGDMLVWSSEYLGTGHVAIVTQVNQKDNYIEVAEQNFLNQAWLDDYARRIPLQKRGEGTWLDDKHLLGWKRLAE